MPVCYCRKFLRRRTFTGTNAFLVTELVGVVSNTAQARRRNYCS
jgi:hypothetical protein